MEMEAVREGGHPLPTGERIDDQRRDVLMKKTMIALVLGLAVLALGCGNDDGHMDDTNWQAQRAEYKTRIENSLDRLNGKIDEMKDEIEGSGEDGEQAAEERLEELKDARNDLQDKLDELQDTTHDTWDDWKDGADNLLDNIGDEIDHITH